MARIRGSVFGPMNTKVDAEMLGDGTGQLVKNMRMTSGAMEPWKLPAAVPGVTLPTTTNYLGLYRYGRSTTSKVNYWFVFATDVDVVKGPIFTDTEERTYWTDGTYPKKTKSSLAGLVAGTGITPTSLRMGIPAPTYTPVASVTGTATDPTSPAITSVYVCTQKSSWGEESAPTNASNIVTWRAGQTVNVTLPGAPPSGSYSVTQSTLYRSNTGTSRTSYQFVADSTIVTTTYADTKTATQLGETCATFDWTTPDDAMIGLTDMGNGMLAAFNGSTVYFCEPNFPYAWPAKYDFALAQPAVGMGFFGQTLVVGTANGYVLLTGSDPGSMSSEVHEDAAHACVSKRSVVSMMVNGISGVMYATPSGLFFIGPGIAQNVTQNFLTHDQWQAYNPASMMGVSIDGRYYAFYDNGTTQASLIFSFGDDGGMVQCDQYTTAAFVEGRLDSMFVVKQAATVNTLYEWNTGSSMTVSWQSKNYRFNSGVMLARAAVNAASYPVTFTLYAGGVSKYVYSVPDANPFPLPDGRDYLISYRIDSAAKVTSVRIASSTAELGDG